MNCPKRNKKGHGTWTVRQELVPAKDKTRRLFRRHGFGTKDEAQEVLNLVHSILAIPDDDDADAIEKVSALLARVSRDREPLPDVDTVRRMLKAPNSMSARMLAADYFDLWLKNLGCRDSAIKRYEVDVRCHLKPHLGHLRMDQLERSIRAIMDMFDSINETNTAIEANNKARDAINAKRKTATSRAESRALCAQLRELPPYRRITGPSTQQHVKATLRTALNKAIKIYHLITYNPAEHVEIPGSGESAKALVWTRARVERWHQTGEVPSPVMVWTAEQVGQFLDFVAEDELYPLWHVMAYRGLRRGEGCGVRWIDLDEDEESLTIATQLVQDGWGILESPPKTDGGYRVIPLDKLTLAVLRRQRTRQLQLQLRAGDTWQDTGRAFTNADGTWLHPGKISKRFERLIELSGLPPIRLHDLRHGAATVYLASGASMKVVQELLGHAEERTTSKFYAHVLPELAKEAAERGAAYIPRKTA